MESISTFLGFSDEEIIEIMQNENLGDIKIEANYNNLKKRVSHN